MAGTRNDILKTMQQIVPFLKHCRRLNMAVHSAGKGSLILVLPYSESIIGNPETGVIHGGALTTLMDTACGFAAMSALDEMQISPTLDLRIDYMCQAEPGLPVFGEAEAYRVTRNVIFARGIAYHEAQREKPIAHCTATFMRLDPKVTEKNQKNGQVLTTEK